MDKKKLAKIFIAVVGIVWIGMQLTLHDRVNVVQANGSVRSMALSATATPPSESDAVFHVEGLSEPVSRADVVSQPDQKKVLIHRDLTDAASPTVNVALLGLHLKGDLNKSPEVDQLVVAKPDGTAGGIRIKPDQVVGGYRLKTPRPVVERGLISMGRNANPWLLALAILVFPITMLITTVRWDQILRSQDIRLPYSRVFVLNMVGNFYNSFFPGSTGGDFIKAYYASRQTSHKIRAMMSVFVDRIIGLFALVILGGAMATYGFFSATDLHAFAHDLGNIKNVRFGQLLTEGDSAPVLVSLSPTARACLGVACGCIAIAVGSAIAALLLSSSRVRHLLRVEQLVKRLPMQHHLDKVRESLRLYQKNIKLVAWWITITFPIHSAVVVSAMIAGQAFGLSIAWPYYFVCVPVMVLVASIPISPQGAGVMEWFGFLLLAKQGVTVSEVLALTLSIRFVQIFWNLVGGLFTMGGQYGGATKSYDEIADEDDEATPVVA